jgi:hypothetical protein
MRNEKVNSLSVTGFTFSFLILHFSFFISYFSLLLYYAW